MSKDLEREYKALVNSEVPDLWARIEAGLDEKTTPRVSGKKIHFRVWAGLAAACVCVVLIVPAMTRMMRMGRSGSGSDMAAPNYAVQSADSYDMAEEAAYDSNGAEAAVTADEGGLAGGVEKGADAETELDYFAVTVEILDADVRMDSGILYTARVIASENPAIQADGEIKIFSPAMSPEGVTVLDNSQIYDLMLREDESDNPGQETTYILADE